MIYEHPILHLQNIVDKDTANSRNVCKISPNTMKDHKRRAHKKARHLVKQALKGNKIRCNKIPGNGWGLC